MPPHRAEFQELRDQMSASAFCVSVSGGANSAGFKDWSSGLGKALRSTFPFGVSGKRSRMTNAEGIM